MGTATIRHSNNWSLPRRRCGAPSRSTDSSLHTPAPSLSSLPRPPHRARHTPIRKGGGPTPTPTPTPTTHHLGVVFPDTSHPVRVTTIWAVWKHDVTYILAVPNYSTLCLARERGVPSARSSCYSAGGRGGAISLPTPLHASYTGKASWGVFTWKVVWRTSRNHWELAANSAVSQCTDPKWLKWDTSRVNSRSLSPGTGATFVHIIALKEAHVYVRLTNIFALNQGKNYEERYRVNLECREQ